MKYDVHKKVKVDKSIVIDITLKSRSFFYVTEIVHWGEDKRNDSFLPQSAIGGMLMQMCVFSRLFDQESLCGLPSTRGVQSWGLCFGPLKTRTYFPRPININGSARAPRNVGNVLLIMQMGSSTKTTEHLKMCPWHNPDVALTVKREPQIA